MASFPSLQEYVASHPQQPVPTHGVEQPLPMRFSWGPRFNPAETGPDKMTGPDQKGVGFYGPQTLGQGTQIAGEWGSTDKINGKLTNYPSFFQGMTQPQLATAMTAARMQQPVPPSIDDAAYAAAKERVNAGRSPFWEQGRDPYPAWSPDQFWEAPYGMSQIAQRSEGMPGSRAHEFNQQQLQGKQAPQYDPEAGIATALEWAKLVQPMGMIKAFGFYPDGHGGYQPSMKEDLEKGRPLAAIGDAIGIAGPILRFGPPALRYFDVRQTPKK